jgi:hypothetical protein
MTDTNTPVRIWAFTYDNCDFDNEDEYLLNVPAWKEKKPVHDATEYVRSDLFAALEAQAAALTAERDAARAGLQMARESFVAAGGMPFDDIVVLAAIDAALEKPE